MVASTSSVSKVGNRSEQVREIFRRHHCQDSVTDYTKGGLKDVARILAEIIVGISHKKNFF